MAEQLRTKKQKLVVEESTENINNTESSIAFPDKAMDLKLSLETFLKNTGSIRALIFLCLYDMIFESITIPQELKERTKVFDIHITSRLKSMLYDLQTTVASCDKTSQEIFYLECDLFIYKLDFCIAASQKIHFTDFCVKDSLQNTLCETISSEFGGSSKHLVDIINHKKHPTSAKAFIQLLCITRIEYVKFQQEIAKMQTKLKELKEKEIK